MLIAVPGARYVSRRKVDAPTCLVPVATTSGAGSAAINSMIGTKFHSTLFLALFFLQPPPEKENGNSTCSGSWDFSSWFSVYF